MKKTSSPEYALLASAGERWKALSGAILAYGFRVLPRVQAIQQKSERLIKKGRRYPPRNAILRSAKDYNGICDEVESSLALIPRRFIDEARARFYRIPLRQDQMVEEHALDDALTAFEQSLHKSNCIAESGVIKDSMKKIATQLADLERLQKPGPPRKRKRNRVAA